MITKHKINMDLTIRSTQPQLAMVQCDRNSRAVEITMTAGGVSWVPEAVDTVFLRYRKSDCTGGSYDALPDGTAAWSMEGNVLTVMMAPQVLSAPGLVEAQAVLLHGDQTVATFSFRIFVEADLSADTVESEDYINWASWAQAELDKRLMEAKNNGDFDGATYLPQVSDQGLLSWSNDRGAENPEPVNIVDLLAEKLGENMFLQKSGGIMTGVLDMGGNRLTGLSAPEADSDAVTRDYADRIFRKTTISLPALLWSNGRIRAQVTGVTADNVVIVSPAADSFEEYVYCGLRCIEQDADRLTFACDTVPEKTVKVNVVVFLRGDKE